MKPILNIENLTKIYGNVPSQTNALNGITLQVMPGEFLGIMGSSGSGKSTLLNCIATVIQPTGGSMLGSEVLLPVAEIADYRVGKLEKRADAMAESLAAIQAATEDAGGQFCYVLVPEQRSALRDYYPDWME